jgi:hypothetical protein
MEFAFSHAIGSNRFQQLAIIRDADVVLIRNLEK